VGACEDSSCRIILPQGPVLPRLATACCRAGLLLFLCLAQEKQARPERAGKNLQLPSMHALWAPESA
jgi:hypothetical protein